jgi:putative membrane protein
MLKQIGVVIASMLLGLFVTVGIPSLAQTNSATPGASMSRPASQQQFSEVDKQYMTDANRNALAAIALGQLALKQASSPQVKEFAQAEMDEQIQVRKNLMQLQSSMGMSLPSTPTAKDQEVQTRMSRLTGAAFDKAFMNEVGINAHLENAAIYQREAALGRNQQLVTVATNGLSIITSHYNTASALTGYQVARVPERVVETSAMGTSSSGSLPNVTSPR